ncbi:MAG: hypothetical protein IPG83_02555 [Novosphingobium sp.]|jgi:hypothetical protein|nr:hypothetical protein [Novosphingobium sp.]
MTTIIESKTGNGSFSVERATDGSILVKIGGDDYRWFETLREAYDWCKDGFSNLQGTMRGYSYLNATFALADAMAEAAFALADAMAE